MTEKESYQLKLVKQGVWYTEAERVEYAHKIIKSVLLFIGIPIISLLLFKRTTLSNIIIMTSTVVLAIWIKLCFGVWSDSVSTTRARIDVELGTARKMREWFLDCINDDLVDDDVLFRIIYETCYRFLKLPDARVHEMKLTDAFGVEHTILQYLKFCEYLEERAIEYHMQPNYAFADKAMDHCREIQAVTDLIISDLEKAKEKYKFPRTLFAGPMTPKHAVFDKDVDIDDYDYNADHICAMFKYVGLTSVDIPDGAAAIYRIEPKYFADYLIQKMNEHPDFCDLGGKYIRKLFVAANAYDPVMVMEEVEIMIDEMSWRFGDIEAMAAHCVDQNSVRPSPDVDADVAERTKIALERWEYRKNGVAKSRQEAAESEDDEFEIPFTDEWVRKTNEEKEKKENEQKEKEKKKKEREDEIMTDFDQAKQKIENCNNEKELLAVVNEIENTPSLRPKRAGLIGIIKKKREELGGIAVYKNFLSEYTPQMIEDKLNERIIGQPTLTKDVADFIYYHVLRQVNPNLPPRPIIISGMSGSGKTEVWRVAQRVFGDIIKIKIVDGAMITSEGWKGGYKLTTLITPDIADRGVFIVDEFDKLTKPSFNSSEENVSLDLQAEFLKVLEGEFESEAKEDNKKIDSSTMGFVLIGAFEFIREEKRRRKKNAIGFDCDREETEEDAVEEENKITDEEYIEFGIMPELVGRIAVKCWTRPLSDEDYLRILKNKYSRVSMIKETLIEYGIDPSDAISDDEIGALIKTSKNNRTGVRWVSSMVEGRMLEYLRKVDMREKFQKDCDQSNA